MTPLERRVAVFNVIPPLLTAIGCAWWAIDQTAFLIALVRDRRATSTGVTPTTSAGPTTTGARA